jgi:hypothetical protein
LVIKRKKMNKFFAKILGFDKILAAKAKAEAELKDAEEKAAIAKEAERIKNLTPKELATEKKEPWVGCLDVQVNKDNVKNGFFELDWNEYFIRELKLNGYQGDTDEEIISTWFSDVARNVAEDEGIDMSRRASGYINTSKIGNGRSIVS